MAAPDPALTGSVPIERMRAVLRLISPDHITPMGRRMIEKVIDEYEQPCPHTYWDVVPGGGTVCRACGVDTSHIDAMGG